MLASSPEKNECVIMDVPCRGTLTCTNEGRGENEGMCPKPETADAPSLQPKSVIRLYDRVAFVSSRLPISRPKA